MLLKEEPPITNKISLIKQAISRISIALKESSVISLEMGNNRVFNEIEERIKGKISKIIEIYKKNQLFKQDLTVIYETMENETENKALLTKETEENLPFIKEFKAKNIEYDINYNKKERNKSFNEGKHKKISSVSKGRNNYKNEKDLKENKEFYENTPLLKVNLKEFVKRKNTKKSSIIKEK